MSKKKTGPGRPKTKRKDDLFVTGSIRLSNAQWKLFRTWGGAEQLRKHLAKVKGGQARHAKA
jgi:hypothetical protein